MPARIVSLVPSLTETVCALGREADLVGITHFCIEPKRLGRRVPAVGGTKDPDLDEIARLAPTHILVNVEENEPEHIERCKAMAPTFVCFPKGPKEVLGMVRELGAFLEVPAAGEDLAARIEDAMGRLERAVETAIAAGTWSRKRYLYFIWREPYMLAGPDTYISGMLDLVRLENAASGDRRYPTFAIPEGGRDPNVDLVLLSSEPYPFRKRDAARLREEWPTVPTIQKIDGRLLSWYGSATLEALHALERWVQGGGQLVSPL